MDLEKSADVNEECDVDVCERDVCVDERGSPR